MVTHEGITVGEDGATHQIIEDVGIMSGLPNMKVIVPVDSVETRSVMEYLADETTTPYYVRLTREKFPVLNEPDYKFREGKSVTFREGKDLTIFANGAMVSFSHAQSLHYNRIFLRYYLANSASYTVVYGMLLCCDNFTRFFRSFYDSFSINGLYC